MNLFFSRSCIALSKRTRSGSSKLLAGALVETFLPQLSRNRNNGKTKKNFLILYLRGGSSHVPMMIADRCGYFQHFPNLPGRFGAMKDRRTRNQNFGAGPHDRGNRIGIDAAINFDDTAIITIFNKLPGLPNPFPTLGHGRWPHE